MPAISVQNLSKCYMLHPDGAQGSFKEAIYGFFSRNRRVHHADVREFWALKDISFDIEHGEVLGICGANGSGKSTLLKILSRITTPTSGQAIIQGRLRSLLEVGTGFHPELTGRENIYLSCAIYGINERETTQIYEAIVEFSGIRDFIDIPVKFYSSGMAVRLAFSVSVHLKADVILLDEVWAVGDADFQKKSLRKMHELITQGTTVVMVSHDPHIVKRFCTRTIELSKGRLV